MDTFDRFESWILGTFGSWRKAASVVGKSKGYFNLYVSRRELPGRRVLQALTDHGLDQYWLETGIETPPTMEPEPDGGEITVRMLWDKYSQIIPDTPGWGELDPSEKSDVLSEISQVIVRQQGHVRTPRRKQTG